MPDLRLKENIEKRKDLLPHLFEHNLEHVEEHRRWVALCEEAGLHEVVKNLKSVLLISRTLSRRSESCKHEEHEKDSS